MKKHLVFILFVSVGILAISFAQDSKQSQSTIFDSARTDTLSYVPNSFSPNGDGVNDTFRIEIPSTMIYESAELWIFDRWGDFVFSNKDPQIGWDGNDMVGNQVPTGVYVYLVRVILGQDTTKFHGQVTLMR